jgi:hypothetical protein
LLTNSTLFLLCEVQVMVEGEEEGEGQAEEEGAYLHGLKLNDHDMRCFCWTCICWSHVAFFTMVLSLSLHNVTRYCDEMLSKWC